MMTLATFLLAAATPVTARAEIVIAERAAEENPDPARHMQRQRRQQGSVILIVFE